MERADHVLDKITALNSHPQLMPTIEGQLGLPPGTHVIHTSGSSDFALRIEAQILGNGGITKRGDKGLLLSGNNSFGGDAVLQEGRLDVSHNNGLGANSGGVFLDGRELHLNSVPWGLRLSSSIAPHATPLTLAQTWLPPASHHGLDQ